MPSRASSFSKATRVPNVRGRSRLSRRPEDGCSAQRFRICQGVVPSVVVENDWFVAEFPADVETTKEPSEDPFVAITEFASEVEPFGIFSVRVTQMSVDPFLAVGATEWTRIYRTNFISKFPDENPEVLDDEPVDVVGA